MHGFRAIDVTSCVNMATDMPPFHPDTTRFRAIDGIERGMRATGIIRDQLWIQFSVPRFLPKILLKAPNENRITQEDLSHFRRICEDEIQTAFSCLQIDRLASINQPENIELRSYAYIDCIFLNFKDIPRHYASNFYRIFADIVSKESNIRHIGLQKPGIGHLKSIWDLFENHRANRVSILKPKIVQGPFGYPLGIYKGYDYEVRFFCMNRGIPYQASGVCEMQQIKGWTPQILNLHRDFRKHARKLEVPEATFMCALVILLGNTAVLHTEYTGGEGIDIDSTVFKDLMRILEPEAMRINPDLQLLAGKFESQLKSPVVPKDALAIRPLKAGSSVAWRKIFPRRDQLGSSNSIRAAESNTGTHYAGSSQGPSTPTGVPGSVASQTDYNRKTPPNTGTRPDIPQRSAKPTFRVLNKKLPSRPEEAKESQEVTESTAKVEEVGEKQGSLKPTAEPEKVKEDRETSKSTAELGRIKENQEKLGPTAEGNDSSRLDTSPSPAAKTPAVASAEHWQALSRKPGAAKALSCDHEKEMKEKLTAQEGGEAAFQKSSRLVFKKIPRTRLDLDNFPQLYERGGSVRRRKLREAAMQKEIESKGSSLTEGRLPDQNFEPLRSKSAPSSYEIVPSRPTSPPIEKITGSGETQPCIDTPISPQLQSLQGEEEVVGMQTHNTALPIGGETGDEQSRPGSIPDKEEISPISEYGLPDSEREMTEIQSQDAIPTLPPLPPPPPDVKEELEAHSGNSLPTEEWTEEMQCQNASPPNEEEPGGSQALINTPSNEREWAETSGYNPSPPNLQLLDPMPPGEQDPLPSPNNEAADPAIQHRECCQRLHCKSVDLEQDFEEFGVGGDLSKDSHSEENWSEDTDTTTEAERRWRRLERDYSVGIWGPHYPGRRSCGSLPPPEKSPEENVFDIEL
ncbi:hypothetical protein TWF173_003274 [Orbilia oligospora]|nr:hypothetical protein TWF173_003274 [Orbilia oligospora]